LSIAFDSRPSRADIEPVALDLIRRRGAEVLGTARRYAASPEDAEDAYQRALEILLTKAPTTREDELLPWLKTVVRNEAFALRKKRERDVPAEHDALDAFAAGDPQAAYERAERYDRLRVGAEALGRLKPQETQALLLKAEGLSYEEIAARLGWSYTKVNRCITEGRRAFLACVEGIESGAECVRLAPLLSALADGEASAEDMSALRPHLRGCAACRATLRDYRAAPRQVAALAAPAAAAGVLGWLGERLTAWWVQLRSIAEGVAASKAAAVAASGVVIAGGGAATVQEIERSPVRAPARAAAAALEAPVAAVPAAARAATPASAGSPSRAVVRSAGDRAGRAAAKALAAPPSAGRRVPKSAPGRPAATPSAGRAATPSPSGHPAARAAEPKPAAAPERAGEFGP
jgi:RNA polymerase sigma factor (sigma-70 family)